MRDATFYTGQVMKMKLKNRKYSGRKILLAIGLFRINKLIHCFIDLLLIFLFRYDTESKF